MTLTEMGDW